ncbi:MAG: radical SAM protein [Nitrososphaerota archaeon]
MVGKMDAGERKILRKTWSICPECNMIIPADLYEEDGRVYMYKVCQEHGETIELYFGDVEIYKKFSRYAHDGKGTGAPNINIPVYSCPANCGLCPGHLSHTALANIVVTNRCDLYCWYCFFFAERVGYVYEPTIEQIREMVRILRREFPVKGNSVQLTGGEPALRDDLPEIIRVIKEEGVDHVQLNTNGIRLARDFEFFKKVKEAGVSNLYLSFDGVTPETNPKNHWEVPKILENARNLNVGIVLVPTIIKSINDHELGEIIKFGFRNIDIIRSVNFQPVSLTGRLTRAERERFRITIPDCIKLIEEQTDGQIPREAWFPVPACTPLTHIIESLTASLKYELTPHFVCGAGTYVFKNGDKLTPITEFIDIDGLIKYLQDRAEELQAGRSKLFVAGKVLRDFGKFIREDKQPEGINVKKMIFDMIIKHDYKSVGDWHRRSLFIGMMHFQDKYNYDVERVMRCSIHYLMPDGRIVPFCAFNVIPEWYRDRVQRMYGVPIDEWEKITGKKAREYYKRILEIESRS